MIVKSDDSKSRQFLGVDFVLLSHGPESMIAKPLAPSDRLIRASKPLLSIMPPVGTFIVI